MAAKRRKKGRKGGSTPGLVRWLALPIGLGLVALAGYLLLGGGSDRAATPRAKRAPVATAPNRRNPDREIPKQAPVEVAPGSHDRDHISEESRKLLLEALESDGETEGDGE